MVMNGMDLPLAVMVTIPSRGATTSPWTRRSGTSTSIMPQCWSRGAPASILFSDGDMMGAVLDRNGLPQPLLYHQRRPSDPFQ